MRSSCYVLLLKNSFIKKTEKNRKGNFLPSFKTRGKVDFSLFLSLFHEIILKQKDAETAVEKYWKRRLRVSEISRFSLTTTMVGAITVKLVYHIYVHVFIFTLPPHPLLESPTPGHVQKKILRLENALKYVLICLIHGLAVVRYILFWFECKHSKQYISKVIPWNYFRNSMSCSL